LCKDKLGEILGSGVFGFLRKATTAIDGNVVSIKIVDISKTNQDVAKKRNRNFL
jgi:hypothetical protein